MVLHQQNPNGEAGFLVVWDVARRAPVQAQGVHRRAAAPGGEGAYGDRRRRQLSLVESAPPHGEEAPHLQADVGGPVRGLANDGGAALPRHRRPESEAHGGAPTTDPVDLLGIKMRPEAGVHPAGKIHSCALVVCVIIPPFPFLILAAFIGAESPRVL